jgi:hypothetical protein
MSQLPEAFFNEWIYSALQGSKNKIIIYKSRSKTSFKFTRPRDVFIIKEDGAFTLFTVDSADRPIRYNGIWKYETNNEIIVLFNNPHKKPLRFEIISVDENELKIKRISTN